MLDKKFLAQGHFFGFSLILWPSSADGVTLVVIKCFSCWESTAMVHDCMSLSLSLSDLQFSESYLNVLPTGSHQFPYVSLWFENQLAETRILLQVESGTIKV